jgi:hypothetical protein
MVAACELGHLSFLKWLVHICGTDDLRISKYNGDTLMHIACFRQHLHIVKWLFEAGLADNFHIENRDKETPIILAFPLGNSRDMTLALWLCEVGAFQHHINDVLNSKRLPMHAKQNILFQVKRRIDDFSALDILLLAYHVGHNSITSNDDSITNSTHTLKSRHSQSSLQRFELKLIKMIANFVGIPIPYGKPLKHLRDFHDALLTTTEP